MRERIDSLRKERVVFDMIYRQLESDIKSKREELIAVMGKTDKAERMRDESRAELDRLKGEAGKLKEMFQTEWNEVVEKSLKEQNETTTLNMNQTKESINKGGKYSSSDRKEHTAEETGNNYSNKLRSTVARAAWAVARDTGSIHVSMQRVQQYEEALATVKEAIGMNGSIQEVVERFQQTEAQNYSLYNYVSELSSEQEQLTEEIRDIEEKIHRHRSYGIGNASQTEF
jgi:chromosome segregation ATPase